ncbi:MAG: alpha-glucuronidase [Treponema sp.]|jgi:alpha-glucuronidase|nr:alpha-glucuronidase [Treponema sp.]
MIKVTEYDCWFQKYGSAEDTKDIAAFLEHVICEEKGIIIENAAKELRFTLSFCFGIVQKSRNAGEKQILLGTIGYLNASYGFSLPKPKKEGFVIRSTDSKIIIGGADEPGVLYGVYTFVRLLALKRFVFGADVADAPVSQVRMINHWDNLDGSVERGYAGRSLFFNDNRIEFDSNRIRDYARLLSSVGINRISINNVNVRGMAKELITEKFLPKIAELADIFRPFGIRLMLSVNFGAPQPEIGTADPLDERVLAWWKDRADSIYRYIPDLAGFLVKADSEYETGPFRYGRNHAEGAHILAKALAPHNGEVIWRCFVYNCVQDWRDTTIDRARAAFDNFKPLDGQFDDNVILQIKHGPYDFQVREPVSPLFGALEKTRYVMELQITQEYTGQQIDLCFLPWMWGDVMRFDTGYGTNADNGAIRSLLACGRIEGLAAVGNTGLAANWTGHTLAQANLFGYGRLAWNPALSPGEIADEWSRLTFPDNGGQSIAGNITKILLNSYPTYQKYNAPFGVCFMVECGHHYGPNVEGYEFSKWGTYHRADNKAIGIDRTPAGTGYTEQYAPKNAAIFANPETCPEELLLFFHRTPYDYVMKNGKTLLQNIYDTHFEGYDEVRIMLDTWRGLQELLDGAVFESVKERMERQLENARQWRDVINTYFLRRTGIGDEKGRKIYR